MMLLLRSYIPPDLPYLRVTHGEGAVAGLPCKPIVAPLTIDPAGRIRLDGSQDVGNCLAGRKPCQTVNMIRHAADFNRFPTLVPDDSTM